MATTYYKLSPLQIASDINKSVKSTTIQIQGRSYLIFPHVYPSDRFRTTNFLLKNIEPLVMGKSICDMGCGMGIVGLYSLYHGAKKVVQADINPLAVENAIANRDFHHFSKRQLKIYESNCFDHISQQLFDVIVFNIPFHSEPHMVTDPLEYAFYDPSYESTRKFLNQSKTYAHSETKILIAFSNKGDIEALERIFNESGLNWTLWKVINTDKEYDNRLYMLMLPNSGFNGGRAH